MVLMGTLLVEYLQRRNLTAAEFSRESGLSGTMISLWCSGKRRPNVVNAHKIERATGGAVPADYWAYVGNDKGPRHV